jgi:hypothetical protein
MLNGNQLMNAMALNGGHVVAPDNPIKDASTVGDTSHAFHVTMSLLTTPQVTALLELKQLVLGNARVLYGSEQRKFFGASSSPQSKKASLTYPDFVTGRNPTGKHSCVLVCSLDGYTRILRKETALCPLEAARALADGLILDAGTLFGTANPLLYLPMMRRLVLTPTPQSKRTSATSSTASRATAARRAASSSTSTRPCIASRARRMIRRRCGPSTGMMGMRPRGVRLRIARGGGGKALSTEGVRSGGGSTRSGVEEWEGSLLAFVALAGDGPVSSA